MAHKTLIGGTAYEIKGGKTLVGGTAYEIKGGKTLVGGTAYDISFVKIVNVRLVYCGHPSIKPLKATVTIDGIEYKNEAKLNVNTMKYEPYEPRELQVLTGIISWKCLLNVQFYYSGAKIIVNGETVAEGQKPASALEYVTVNYDYKLRRNVQIAWSIVDNWEILTITEV